MKKCYDTKYDNLCAKGLHVIRKHVTLMRVIKKTVHVPKSNHHRQRCKLKVLFRLGRSGWKTKSQQIPSLKLVIMMTHLSCTTQEIPRKKCYFKSYTSRNITGLSARSSLLCTATAGAADNSNMQIKNHKVTVSKTYSFPYILSPLGQCVSTSNCLSVFSSLSLASSTRTTSVSL